MADQRTDKRAPVRRAKEICKTLNQLRPRSTCANHQKHHGVHRKGEAWSSKRLKKPDTQGTRRIVVNHVLPSDCGCSMESVRFFKSWQAAVKWLDNELLEAII